MVEKHYEHLVASWRAEEAEKHAPSLDVKAGKVQKVAAASAID
jgi:hypothetical protein